MRSCTDNDPTIIRFFKIASLDGADLVAGIFWIMKKITVVIPVYNEAPYLRRCLDSLVRQTHYPEVILVNDGSTDKSGEILEEYRCFGFKIYHQKNKGVSAARNFGLSKVKTEWVTFLDSDDKMVEDAIEQMERATKTNYKIYQFNHLRVYRDGKYRKKYWNRRGVYSAKVPPKKWAMVWNKLYRTDFLKENKIRFKLGLNYGEDEIFNLECLLKEKLIRCEDSITMVKYFDNPQSLVRTLNSKKIINHYQELVALRDGLQRPEDISLLNRWIKKYEKSPVYQKEGIKPS